MFIQVLSAEVYLRYQRRLSGVGAGVEYTHIARMQHPVAGPVTVFTKLYQDPAKPLLNEVIGYLLAHALGLTQPHLGFLALIPIHALEQPPGWLRKAQAYQDTWPAWCTSQVDGAKAPGLIFQFKECASLNRFKKDLMRWVQLPQVLGFDEWIGNVDRHFNNLLRLGKSKYAIIDHGRLLATSGHWQAEKIHPLEYFRNRLIEHLWAGQPPLSVKNQMIHYAEGHAQAFATVEEELDCWTKVLLSGNEPEVIVAFLRERARLGPELTRKRYGVLV